MTPENATASFWIVDRAGTRERADADTWLNSSFSRSGVCGRERHSSHRSASSDCIAPTDIAPKKGFRCNLMLCSCLVYFLGLMIDRPRLSSRVVLASRSLRWDSETFENVGSCNDCCRWSFCSVLVHHCQAS